MALLDVEKRQYAFHVKRNVGTIITHYFGQVPTDELRELRVESSLSRGAPRISNIVVFSRLLLSWRRESSTLPNGDQSPIPCGAHNLTRDGETLSAIIFDLEEYLRFDDVAFLGPFFEQRG